MTDTEKQLSFQNTMIIIILRLLILILHPSPFFFSHEADEDIIRLPLGKALGPIEEDEINVPMTLGVFRDKGSRRWSMAWYEALVQRWQGASVVVAWVAPGGILAFVAAGGVVAAVVGGRGQCMFSPMPSDTLCVVTNFSLHRVTVKRLT